MYDFDFEETNKIKGGYIKKFLLHPPFWNDPSNKIGFQLNWKKYKFNRRNHTKIIRQKGIYCFVVEPKVDEFFSTRYLFYIGKTNRTLFKRFGEYLDELEGKRKSRVKVMFMLKQYQEHLYYYFTPISTTTKVNSIEDKLIDTFIPHVNTQVRRAKIKPEFQYLYE